MNQLKIIAMIFMFIDHFAYIMIERGTGLAGDFYMIDPSTADVCYAVFTNQLEKEFAVEIAHLWNDGTLHRIYHLIY